jgi:hypothetical protein
VSEAPKRSLRPRLAEGLVIRLSVSQKVSLESIPNVTDCQAVDYFQPYGSRNGIKSEQGFVVLTVLIRNFKTRDTTGIPSCQVILCGDLVRRASAEAVINAVEKEICTTRK